MDKFAQEVQAMHYRYQGMLDAPHEPLAQSIHKHFDNLKLEVNQHRNPLTIRDHLKRMREDVHTAADKHIVNYGEAATLKAWIEHSMNNFK